MERFKQEGSTLHRDRHVEWPGSKPPHYTILKSLKGPEYGVTTDDVVKGMIVGHTITAYTNGRLQFQITDGKFATGNPGLDLTKAPVAPMELPVLRLQTQVWPPRGDVNPALPNCSEGTSYRPEEQGPVWRSFTEPGANCHRFHRQVTFECLRSEVAHGREAQSSLEVERQADFILRRFLL